MWYKTKNSNDINLSMPITATNSGEKYLLIPQIEVNRDYEVKGFNWISLKDGHYGSCACFKTAEAAMKSWRANDIVNSEITITDA